VQGCAKQTASGLPLLSSRVKLNKYFIEFSFPFLFKSAMFAGMNRLFEQDPAFPHFGSREEQMSFYSAKLALSDEKKSGPARTSGGPIRKPRRAKVALRMPYSKLCTKVLQSMSDSDDDVKIFCKKPTAVELDDDDLSILTGKPPPLAENINVRAQIESIRQGAFKVRLIRPLPQADLAADVEMLVRECINKQTVTSLELLVSHRGGLP
jgi:hypothetical protein